MEGERTERSRTSRKLRDQDILPPRTHSLVDVCDQHNDVATANLIKNVIDETENRAWFL
jgi:starvation-inducible DNA-binding protein